MTCQHPDNCPRPVKADGWCRAHWDRVRKTGNPGPVLIRPRKPLGRPCPLDGCDNAVMNDAARDMCGMHYQRWRKHGSPDVVLTGGASLAGPANPNWSEVPTYSATHTRLRNTRGRASNFECVDCGARARHWSYDNADPAELVDPKWGRYSADLGHYEPRCVPCHSAFDGAARVALMTGERP